jgi:twitching motility two-component system response regulator PilH
MNAVMILEPDVMQRDLMVLALRRHQLQTIVCPQSHQIEEMLAQHCPEILILDLLLRGRNGLDLLDLLKKKGLLEKTKVLLISPMGFPEIVRKAARAGAAAFVVKPLDPDQLAERSFNMLHGAAGVKPA